MCLVVDLVDLRPDQGALRKFTRQCETEVPSGSSSTVTLRTESLSNAWLGKSQICANDCSTVDVGTSHSTRTS